MKGSIRVDRQKLVISGEAMPVARRGHRSVPNRIYLVLPMSNPPLLFDRQMEGYAALVLTD